MLWYLVRCGISILIGFIIWVAAAQLGSFIFRGTSMEDVMILVAVLGLFCGMGLTFKTWPKYIH